MKKPNTEVRDAGGVVHRFYADRVTTTKEYVEFTNVEKNPRYEPELDPDEDDYEEPKIEVHVATFYRPIYVKEIPKE